MLTTYETYVGPPEVTHSHDVYEGERRAPKGVCDMIGDMLKSGVCSEKQSTIQLEKHLQQCVTRLNQTESLMCVCGGGGSC